MNEDRFTWSSEADADGKTTFAMEFSLPSGRATYGGRATADSNQQTILAARWLSMMATLRECSRLMTAELVREAWFACIGIPTPAERLMVERAREVIATHIGSEGLAKIYREAA